MTAQTTPAVERSVHRSLGSQHGAADRTTGATQSPQRGLMESVDVAIIGAGPSGLHAARLLGPAEHSVVVLEARDRVGGRMFSPCGLDVGPSWFWSNERRINALINEFEIDAFAQHLDGDAMFQSAEGVQRMQGNQIDGPAGRIRGGMQRVLAWRWPQCSNQRCCN